jgi:hypothetical protein
MDFNPLIRNGGGVVEIRTASSVDSVPTRPRKASPEAARLLFSQQGGAFVLWLLGGIFTLIGVIMSVIFLWGIPVDLAIVFTGREVEASVLNTKERTDVTITVNRVRQDFYEIEYEYELNGERHRTTSSTIDKASIEAALQGRPVTVEVAGINPSWSRIKGSTYNFFGYIPLFVLLFPMIGISLLLVTIIGSRRRRRVFTNGSPVLAKVVSAELDRMVRINRRHPFKVSWGFEHKGARYQGSLSAMDGLQHIAQGQEVVVLFDPERPATNTLYLE